MKFSLILRHRKRSAWCRGGRHGHMVDKDARVIIVSYKVCLTDKVTMDTQGFQYEAEVG